MAREFLKAYTSETRNIEVSDSTDAIKSDVYFLHLFRAIDFCATVTVGQSNNSEPATPPFAWPFRYNCFFEVTRGDCFATYGSFSISSG